MYTLLLVSDGHKHFASAIDEYIKRLGKQLQIQMIKPHKHGKTQTIITKETEAIRDRLRQWSYDHVFILNPQGQHMDTPQRVKKTAHKKCCFVMWWPYGLDYDMLSSYTHVSLWAQTMPHGLACLILCEQLYRVQTISIGKTYHY